LRRIALLAFFFLCLLPACVPQGDPLVNGKTIKSIRPDALEFRILASTQYDADGPIIELARAEPGRTVNAEDGTRLAFWVPVVPREAERLEATQAIITRKRENESEVLVLCDDYNVIGADVRRIYQTKDMHSQPALGFELNDDGGKRFYALTHANKMDPGNPQRARLLGIIMNGQLFSAPRLNAAIRNSGIIEFGTRNTKEEIRQLEAEMNDLLTAMSTDNAE